MKKNITSIVNKYNQDKTRLLDIYWEIQNKFHYVSDECLELLAPLLNLSVPELNDTLSFYHFFHHEKCGENKIYLDNSAISEISGYDEVLKTFQEELGCKIGQTDPSGAISLFATPCIGMSDQSPAALVNGFPITRLTPTKIKKLVKELKAGQNPKTHVDNDVHLKGPVIFDDYQAGEAISKLAELKQKGIIDTVSEAGIRGRGGAGFKTGLKWKLCSDQKEKHRYVICNADEGEPGTFKDRFLLTEKPEMIFEGMTVAAQAIGAKEGIVYLRGEYRYLLDSLNKTLQKLKKNNFLGKNIAGIKGFDFDIRIQLGAGAYVVGEETALLESLEGKRGEPRVRPPFPVEKGYLGKPTIVNNVETFATVTKIIKHGAIWYRGFGTKDSPGTKLLSVSGDCSRPGIYEVEWGVSIGEFLHLVGAEDPLAVQVGGPSGKCIDAREKHRTLAFEDLATGGSMMVFNKTRNILKIVKNFTQFFVNESCGCCVPCRAGNIVLNEQIDSILNGEGAMVDLERIKDWSKLISSSSRCGLGQTCSNPLISSMNSFPEIYKNVLKEHESLYRPFDVDSKLKEYEEVVKIYGKES